MSQIPSSLSQQDFWDLIGGIEHEQLEFKVKAADFLATIAAMSMSEGGLIILGIDDKRNILGCPLTQKVLDHVKKASHSCGVATQIKEVTIGRFKITMVAVPEVLNHIVTTPDGRLLRRIGSDNQPLVGDALARFVREREKLSAEEDTVPLADLSRFNLELRKPGFGR